MQAVVPDARWVHCSIDREVLAAKRILDRQKDGLDNIVKMVNFIQAKPLNSHVLSALCNEIDSDHLTLLIHTEVQWLSRCKVLTRIF